MIQLDKIWDVGVGQAARLVYLWTVTETLDDEPALLTNLVVMMDACPRGSYPHRLAIEWHQEGFNCDEARAWIRAGVIQPATAGNQKRSGHVPDEFKQQHPRIAAV